MISVSEVPEFLKPKPRKSIVAVHMSYDSGVITEAVVLQKKRVSYTKANNNVMHKISCSRIRLSDDEYVLYDGSKDIPDFINTTAVIGSALSRCEADKYFLSLIEDLEGADEKTIFIEQLENGGV